MEWSGAERSRAGNWVEGTFPVEPVLALLEPPGWRGAPYNRRIYRSRPSNNRPDSGQKRLLQLASRRVASSSPSATPPVIVPSRNRKSAEKAEAKYGNTRAKHSCSCQTLPSALILFLFLLRVGCRLRGCIHEQASLFQREVV